MLPSLMRWCLGCWIALTARSVTWAEEPAALTRIYGTLAADIAAAQTKAVQALRKIQETEVKRGNLDAALLVQERADQLEARLPKQIAKVPDSDAPTSTTVTPVEDDEAAVSLGTVPGRYRIAPQRTFDLVEDGTYTSDDAIYGTHGVWTMASPAQAALTRADGIVIRLRVEANGDLTETATGIRWIRQPAAPEVP